MQGLSRVITKILTLFLFLCVTTTSSANIGQNVEVCNVNVPCSDGLVCSGAVGQGNGVCVMTGPQVVMCKTVEYFDSKLANVFAIFAIVMIGIAFFLGKISWGMIMSVVLGIGIIKGSTTIVKRISGQTDGFCSAPVSYDALTTEGCYVTVNSVKNTTLIFNTLSQGELCPNPLDCKRIQCAPPNGTHYALDEKLTGTTGTNIYLPSGTNPSDIRAIKHACTQEMWDKRMSDENAKQTCIYLSMPPCVDFPNTVQNDYFLCKNACTGGKTTGHKETLGKFTDCKHLNSSKVT